MKLSPAESTETFSKLSVYHLDNQDDRLKVLPTESFAESTESFTESLKLSPTESTTESTETFSKLDTESFIESIEISKLINNVQANWYKRRTNTKDNMMKYEAAKKRLERLGYVVLEESDKKVSIKKDFIIQK